MRSETKNHIKHDALIVHEFLKNLKNGVHHLNLKRMKYDYHVLKKFRGSLQLTALILQLMTYVILMQTI